MLQWHSCNVLRVDKPIVLQGWKWRKGAENSIASKSILFKWIKLLVRKACFSTTKAAPSVFTVYFARKLGGSIATRVIQAATWHVCSPVFIFTSWCSGISQLLCHKSAAGSQEALGCPLYMALHSFGKPQESGLALEAGEKRFFLFFSSRLSMPALIPSFKIGALFSISSGFANSEFSMSQDVWFLYYT